MNFGLALAKPGESNLGLASRLWQANDASWHLDSLFMSQRINQEITSQHQIEFTDIDGEPKGLAVIRAFERLRFPEVPRADLPRGLGRTKTVRHCLACAQGRYHSIYFNTPWIDQCPVHNDPLLIECPACNKAWPGADNVHKRICLTCGIRRKSDSPTKLGLLDSEEYNVIRELDLFFSQSINIGLPRMTHLSHLSTARSDDYAKTLLYPSVLAAHRYTKQPKWVAPTAIDAILQPCKHKRFKINLRGNWNERIADDHIPRMSRIRQKVLDAGLASIQAMAGHPIGSCEQDPISCQFDCVHCECSRQLECVLYRHAGRGQPLVNYHLQRGSKQRYLDPGLFLLINDVDTDMVFNVPPSIKWLLYELDIVSCVKRLILQVHSSMEQVEVSSNKSIIRDEHQSLLGGYSPFTNYYYFVIEEDYCHLYYPVEYENTTFSSFKCWLAITRTF